MQKTITIATDEKEMLYDITAHAESFIAESETKNGLLNIYVRGATAGIMIQENWDESVQRDVVSLLQKLIPRGVWLHDAQDSNGDAHLKAGIVGPSETVPVKDGKLMLSTWQNIFVCEFDGPRAEREIMLTLINDK
ncbi:secondary thiamine-phosphate synthase enzyme [Limihaloglobus sulfuriphilus]|uniref:Secondary thiamine-phosphate synthase enzyme n=1 Tax=Limihaloglobus sulfuriphilus TaxID=1851148 RepID=A0A1Q2MBI5_9BACT|nr:secondary thiamine-phosphate synthase enzyme YjbQ [Limihaloglobus sulfuriphilus]AQQ70034.1 secondary thiamine-phosphate synthase enzyme [Limihaloglobus sulfuriphilus]